MGKLFLFLAVGVLLLGCQSVVDKARFPFTKGEQRISIENNTPEPLKYGHWSPSLDGVICITGRLIVRYDDLTGSVSEGVYDRLAKGFKWRDEKYMELTSSSTEVIANTKIYILRYKTGFMHMKQRIVFGENDHSEWGDLDKNFVKKGYERMSGEVSVAGKVSDNQSTCWGIRNSSLLERSILNELANGLPDQ